MGRADDVARFATHGGTTVVRWGIVVLLIFYTFWWIGCRDVATGETEWTRTVIVA